MSLPRATLRAGLVSLVVLACVTTLLGTSAAGAATRASGPRVVSSVAMQPGYGYVAHVKVRAIRKSTRALIEVRQVVGGSVVAKRRISVGVQRRAWRSASLRLPKASRAGTFKVVVRSLGGRRKPVKATSVVTSSAPPVATRPARTGSASTPGTSTPGTSTPGTSTPGTSIPAPPDPARWRADMVEEFDSLAADRWSVAHGWGAANESSWLQAGNVSTVGGVLRVQGKAESAGGRSYTSGRLDTNGKYALPDYFRAEVRAKVPYQRGLWSAPLWFRPTNGQMGEIDLVETYGSEQKWPTVHQTIHSAYGADHRFVSLKSLFSRIGRLAPTAWHTYTIEKTPGQIKMWVDGVPTATFTRATAPWFDTYYEAGKRWNLRVNMQIGGSYGLPDSTTAWSGDNSVMQLDYIKTWVPR